MATLTAGAIDSIISGREVKEPVLKVLGHKNVPGGSSGQNRYRLLLSDGEKTHSFCMLATQMNHFIDEGKISSNTVIRVKKYVCNNVQSSKTVLIVLELEVLVGGVDAGKEVAGSSSAASKPPLAETNGTSPQKPHSSGFGMAGTSSPATPRTTSGPSHMAASPATPSSASGVGRVFPINSLNPYQNRWTIRARVNQKSAVRTWSNSRGEGKLFSFVVADESGEVKVTAFRDEVDKYFDLIEINKVYYISRGTLKTANPQYNSTKNEYEMTLNSDSVIQPCEDSNSIDLPLTHFQFVQIGKLDSHQANDFVDVVGVVHEVGEVQSITSRTTQKELRKRDVTLVDDSKCQVKLTLWGDEAVNFPTTGHPVLVVKGARLSDFGGRSLTTTIGNTTVMISPTNVPEAVRLRGWYEHEGRDGTFDSYRNEGGSGGGSQTVTLAELKAGGVGAGEKPDYFSVMGTLISMKRENCMYQACGSDGCNKKVIDLNNGLYRCEKCNLETPNFKWRLLLQANIADHTDNQWITCFQDNAETILGKTASELGNLKELQQTNEYDSTFQTANFKTFNFRLRAKMETYNDESRLKVVAVDTKPVDYAQFARQLISEVQKIFETLK